MSLQQLAAQRMASQGRGPDSQLVHMSPREVAGLQALAMAQGGSLTINPETGLPEAGFLDKMLPMILGIGATALTGGAAAPWMVGLGVGALQTARTGSLEKGLMAGLGAYGGAGLAGGLMAAGAGAGAGAAGAAGTDAISVLGGGAGAPAMPGITGAANAVPTAPPLEMFSQGAAPPMPEFFSQSPALNAGSHVEALGTPRMPFSTPVTPPTTPPPSTIGQNLSQAGQGFKNLGTEAGRKAFMGQAASKGVEATGVGGGMGLLKYGAAAAAPMLMGDTTTKMPEEDNERFNYAFDAGRTEEGYVDPVTGQRQYFRPTYRRLAAGGPVEEMSAANVYAMQNARGGVSDMGIDAFTGMQRMAGGGISHLGDYSDGGRLLKGPGDGVSDSIPAMIGNRQPARLADGEFVIPARIVSELGNGSTEPGARKLYAMMDRIQNNRRKTIGDDNVAVDSKSDKYLPA